MRLENIKQPINHNKGVVHFKPTSECLSSFIVFSFIDKFLTTTFGLQVIFFLNTINEQEHCKKIKIIIKNFFILI